MTGTPTFDWPDQRQHDPAGGDLRKPDEFRRRSSRPTPARHRSRSSSGPGAAGSSGTVIEPYSIQAKFPHAEHPCPLLPRCEPGRGLLSVGQRALPTAGGWRPALPALGGDPAGRGDAGRRGRSAAAGGDPLGHRRPSSRRPTLPGGGTATGSSCSSMACGSTPAAPGAGSHSTPGRWPTATTSSGWWRSPAIGHRDPGAGRDSGGLRQPRPPADDSR